MKKFLYVFLILALFVSFSFGQFSGIMTASAEVPKAEEFKTDVVVVGAGGTGMAAAIQARQLGADVILLEKLAVIGGTSAHTEGLFAVGSHWQKEANVDLTSATVIQKVMDYHHWLADASLTKTFFDKSSDTIDWLEDLGVVFNGVLTLGPSLQTWHTYEGMGPQYTQSLFEAVKKHGIEVMLETPATELIMDNGVVAGVKAVRSDGSEIAIKAKSVILATGGYSDNEEMINEYTNHKFSDLVSIGSAMRTGDGIQMALAVGADTHMLGTLMMCGGVIKDMGMSSHLNVAAGRQPMLWVNENAKRFANEGIVTNFSFSGNAMSLQKAVYNVMNRDVLQYLHDNGCFMGRGVYVLTGAPLTKVFDELKEEIKANNPDVFHGETIEELAEKMGVNADELAKTVNKYNDYCETGADLDFGKPEKYLLSLEKGPYYAFKLSKAYYCSVGGLKVNLNCAVLDTRGEIIPGLYAGGCDAGGLYGDSYDVGIAAGSQEGWAVNSGRIAAEAAVAYINKK